jgi:hypothetical protein
MPQKVTIVGGGFQDSEGNPLALGTVQVALQQDVQVGNVQLVAGIRCTLNLDVTGNVTGSPKLWGPATYIMTASSAEGQRVTGYLSIAVPDASTFDLTP